LCSINQQFMLTMHHVCQGHDSQPINHAYYE
jgi:hypothetical protein